MDEPSLKGGKLVKFPPVLVATFLAVMSATRADEPPSLLLSSPAEWQRAIARTESGEFAKAVAAFVMIIRKEGTRSRAPAAELARYYVLYNLAELERFADVSRLLNLLDPGRLPILFRSDARRLTVQSHLEAGHFKKAVAAANPLVDTDDIPSGRLLLLQGRALAHLDRTREAIEALTAGLVSSGDAPINEKRKAVAELVHLLERQGRLAEARELERVGDSVWGRK